VPGRTAERLAEHHDRSEFDCGHPALSDWLRGQAGQFEERGLSRTYVLVDPGHPRVWGYYSISSRQVRYEDLPPQNTKRLPRRVSIPAALIGKLAVDRSVQGQGLGGALLVDALRRIRGLADVIGMRVIIVDAIDTEAEAFYRRHGFEPILEHPRRLFLSIRSIQELGDPLPA
jgi:ribosomal protein S18 acetylase RimI-like enzyme